MKITEALTVARQHMDMHGLNDWKVQTNNRKVALGVCDYRKRTIFLSYHLIPAVSDEKALDTILHEIAHALAGYHAKHGPVWKAMCRRIGAQPSRVYNAPQEERDAFAEKAKYTLICNGPHHKGAALGGLHRLTKNYKLGMMKCRKCGTQVEVVQNY